MSIFKPAVDWITIEVAYRAGVRSVNAIAKEHGVSETAVRKHASTHGWVREDPTQSPAPASRSASPPSVTPARATESAPASGSNRAADPAADDAEEFEPIGPSLAARLQEAEQAASLANEHARVAELSSVGNAIGGLLDTLRRRRLTHGLEVDQLLVDLEAYLEGSRSSPQTSPTMAPRSKLLMPQRAAPGAYQG